MALYKRSDFSQIVTKSMTEQRDLRKSLGAVRAPGVFLSHSHLDNALVTKVIALFQQHNASVYVDWMDDGLPNATNRETADLLKKKIASTPRFVVLATDNALKSRWMPWELGVADTRLDLSKIAVMAIAQDDGTFAGNEYLQLYARIEAAPNGSPAVYEPGNKPGVYLSKWLG